MEMGQFKKRGNAKSPITAVITAVITAREYYREAPFVSYFGGPIAVGLSNSFFSLQKRFYVTLYLLASFVAL